MKKPRVSRWMTGRSSNTPGRDVSIRCINSGARLFAHFVARFRKWIVGQINRKLLIRTGQSYEENSRDFRSISRNTRGSRDCELRQATAHNSYTSQWSGGDHLSERWRGSSLARFLFSCSSAHNGGRDLDGPAHKTLGSQVSRSD